MNNISELFGKILFKIDISPDKTEVRFYCTDDSAYLMYHFQDCCESVTLEEVIGDIDDLLNELILEAEEVSTTKAEELPEGVKPGYDSWTWTFYKLGTRKGYVTLRWLGESNGYYSETVEFERLNK